MNTASERTTAQIIPFPTRAMRSAALGADRLDQDAQAEKARFADLAFGGSWYHQEALVEPTPPKAN
ncbi:DUF2735 domain-containing protein [Rhizobium sp. 0TCS1.26]|uniref:DUF2735 domain-containing protein n=1 Tax=Rhizobium sp. 0TCS1.26 TaxID=3142623 RepID=UPI003D2998BE